SLSPSTLQVIVLVGVNGSGKTTVAGKLAHLHKSQGEKPLLVAGDTFRAAATEQLAIWARRAGVRFVHGQEGGDPAAVVFDGVQSAKAHHENPVIVDTAGRLQTKNNLMDELGKIFRVISKAAPDAAVQGILVLDATLGQNMLSQAKLFNEAAPVSGLILTKLDGTSKGGAILSVVELLKVPVDYVGTGEGIGDIAEFSAQDFAAALTCG
ncbi:MAG: signal recognition particle-docking protein FtsY, partial [Methylocella sp.]